MDEKAIVHEFVGHYKELLGTSVDRISLNLEVVLDGPRIVEDQWSSLDFSKDEVGVALFNIDNEKSPGSDGYCLFFFKSAWPIIFNDIFAAVQEFFTSRKLLKQWNHAIIALIPNSGTANVVNDYRPISCCTVFYKIISKMLVNILRQAIGGLIDKSQAAFIADRSIVDNIHLAQEICGNILGKGPLRDAR